ncbi:MAG TPA: class I SAM-dependent methyltransferase [Marmoricola sp.]|jgi:predicted O-methyltransferase YrrM|nr:class I SAM-dependent methyltransferase [Marmoricola sp.]
MYEEPAEIDQAVPSTSNGPGEPVDWAQAWSQADQVAGWLKPGQAQILWDEARALPPGATALEIGSHQGRSTVVLGHALAATGGHVVAVDPFVEGRLFGGLSTKEKFESNIAAAGLEPVVEQVQDYSTSLRPGWTRGFDLLYIDGKHDYWTLSDDLRWAVHLPAGAAVVIHDCYSSIGVTLGILRHVLFSGSLAYERRSDSQALFRVRRPSTADRLRILAELPWWIRNVFLKVLLRFKLRGAARIFGHDSPYDPY